MIMNALIMTGEKTLGDTLDSTESAYYLSRLNSMLDSWSLNPAMIQSVQQTSFALTTSQGSYTIGSGGDFSMTRPTKIIDPCFIRDSDDQDRPLQLIDTEAYGRIVQKTADGSYPAYLYYDEGYSSTSTGTVKLWPEPSASLTLYINTLQPLQTFTSVSTAVVLPTGYQRAIETNFAVETAPGFVTLDKEVIAVARESKAAIRVANAPKPISRVESGLQAYPRSNILTGP